MRQPAPTLLAPLHLLILLSLGACTTPGVESPQANLAGVPEWHLSDAPLVTIGGADQRPGYRLTQVKAARFLDDVGVVLIDPSDGGVGFYSPDGSLRSMHSGKGDGPGEFRSPYSLSIDAAGDVHVWDMWQRRISTMAPDGSFLGSSTVDRGSMVGLGWPIRTLSDGSVWTTEVDQTSWPAGTSFLAMPIVRLDPVTWERLGILVVMPGRERFIKVEGSTLGQVPVIFGRTSVFSDRLDLIAADTESPVFFVLNNEGDTTRRIEVPWTPVAVSADMVEVALAAAVMAAEDMYGGPGVPQAVVASFKEKALLGLSGVPTRETLPAWEDFFQSRDGNLWIGLFTLPGAPTTQTLVLSRTGDVLGTLELPVGAKLLDAIEGRILVLTKDEWDVPTLSVYVVEGAP